MALGSGLHLTDIQHFEAGLCTVRTQCGAGLVWRFC